MNFLLSLPTWAIIAAILVFAAVVALIVAWIINRVAPIGREDETGFHADRYIEPSDICDHAWRFDSPKTATCVRCGKAMER